MKYLILVGDGMGDYPLEELDNRTPLEAASTPMMDELCRKGEFFLTSTVPEGYPPGSDVANMSLMGYDPAAYYTGRAPFEAAAMGITLAEDELAFRCNMVTLDYEEGGRVKMRDFCAGHIENSESHELIAALEAACSSAHFHFKPGVSYRHLLLYKGERPGFTTVPPHDHIGKDVTAFYNEYFGPENWKALIEGVGPVLERHPVNAARLAAGKNPANMIWLWGEGGSIVLPKLHQRFGLSGTMVSAVDLLKGLGLLAGLNSPDIPGATGYIDTNYAAKAEAALTALGSEDFVFVHLEGPDEAGHKGSIEDKLTAIEDFDAKIVRPIIEELRKRGDDFRAVVTMDHFTPIALRTHVSDPVPTILYDSREQSAGSGLSFCEKNCKEYEQKHAGAIGDGHRMIEKLILR
ncbi:MAG: cofactor-independent phosphoglycerate mutase [Deltaproteobacteria bacterium]|nr:MAG: cofactor-independent phosphoglycerate mutase [Deltaproteobacteria bacterium]